MRRAAEVRIQRRTFSLGSLGHNEIQVRDYKSYFLKRTRLKTDHSSVQVVLHHAHVCNLSHLAIGVILNIQIALKYLSQNTGTATGGSLEVCTARSSTKSLTTYRTLGLRNPQPSPRTHSSTSNERFDDGNLLEITTHADLFLRQM